MPMRAWRGGALSRAVALAPVLMAGGCVTKSDPAALIPASVQAEVLTQDREPGAISVEEMLARARADAGDQVLDEAPAVSSPPLPARAVRQAPAAASVRPANRFDVIFAGAAPDPSKAQAAMLVRAIAAARLPAGTRATLVAGPGGAGGAFDRALLANRRAEAVRSLLPQDWTVRLLYDPHAAPDRVSVVIGART